MTDAEQWENLANQFLMMSREVDSFTLTADFTISAGSVKWRVNGSNQTRWELLAAKAGLLRIPKCTNPIDAWLTELLKEGAWPGQIPQLALVSERRARILARDTLIASVQQNEASVPDATVRLSISEQIEAFRVEADISQERLAELVGRSARTIQRHLSNETTPGKREIFRYEKEFSKLLNRAIVIRKLS